MTTNTSIPKHFEEVLEKLASNPGSGTSRRNFLKGSSMLMVSFSVSGLAKANPLSPEPALGAGAAAAQSGPYLNPGPDPKQLDSWIAVHEDGSATFYNGKTDNGQGLGTAFRQYIADELDLAYGRTRIIFGDTSRCVDQGGMSASTGIENAGPVVRKACAEARRVLLNLAAARLGVTVDKLSVKEGVISITADPSKKVTYQELIAGKRFNTTITWNGSYGNGLDISVVAKVKPVQEYKVIGQSIPRDEIPLQATGRFTYNVDVKIPGMLHARSVMPPVAGAKLVSIDESSVRGLPGFVKVVSKGNYVAVVFEREEQAVKAVEQLKVTWENPAKPSFPTSEGLYDYIRQATPLATAVTQSGDINVAFASAAKVVEATYEHPFTSHSSFTPGCAVVDPRDGQMTIWTGSQKAYDVRRGVAAFLDLPLEKVRTIWVEGPGSYGRNDAGDNAFEAAFIANEVKRPVRLQSMRHEATAWDPKGPAGVMKMRGALNAQGNMIALDYESIWATANNQVASRETGPIETLVGQMMGAKYPSLRLGNAGNPSQGYDVPNKRTRVHQVPLGLVYESPLRVSNLRAPQSLQTTFASESFIDELAAAAKADPVEFRQRHRPADGTVNRARAIAVVKAAAQAYGWDNRPSPKARGTGPILTGRGIGAQSAGGNGAITATIAEVEVNVQTGYVRVKRFVIGYDAGVVVNPEGLRNVLQGQTLQSTSRILKEEVTFDTAKVTSIDWVTYPILTHVDVTDKFDIVFVNGDPNPNRPDLPHYEGGEAATGSPGPAIGNAIFDATGVRLRRVPFTPARVLAALKAAGY